MFLGGKGLQLDSRFFCWTEGCNQAAAVLIRCAGALAGLAGAVSRTATAPVDRLKMLLQVQEGRRMSIREGMRMMAAEGVC